MSFETPGPYKQIDYFKMKSSSFYIIILPQINNCDLYDTLEVQREILDNSVLRDTLWEPMMDYSWFVNCVCQSRKVQKIWDSGGEQNIYVSHNSYFAALYTSIFKLLALLPHVVRQGNTLDASALTHSHTHSSLWSI